MQAVLFGGKSQILINGKTGRIIMSKRSLRQGDPLSPLLFVLATDSLIKMLNLATSKGLLVGIGQYVDDIMMIQCCSVKPIRNI